MLTERWPESDWRGKKHGHEGAAIFLCQGRKLAAIARNLHLAKLIEWGVDEHLLFSVLAHHGRL